MTWVAIDEAFDRALDLRGAEREAFLASLPADRRSVVLELLEATDADDPLSREVGEIAGRLLEEADDALDRSAGDLAAGRRVGPWRVLERLGGGGMGVVYRAERADEAYRQQVALKVIRWELADASLVDRFLVERQILAQLDHPHIASLLDGGMTESGLPYLVLELVEGRPIDEYCDAEGLDVRERVELFVSVCRAVDFAHRGLVVHRDLKPSNLLVRDDGVPKLLDFGVAKLLDEATATSSTRTLGSAPLTPRYAAPEQRAGEGRGEPVTVAADVWALGTLLGELIDGAPERPPRGASRRDLRNVVGRALREEPERRYRSAGDLADDLERWLARRPVRATPPTPGYRLGLWIRRHRATAAALGLAAALLIAGVVGVLWQADAARRERDEARRQQLRAEQITAFLRTLFESAEPRLGEEPRVRDLLDRGAERIHREMADAPLARAELLATLGQSYRWLDDHERSEALLLDSLALVEAHDPGSVDHAMVLAALGNVVRRTDDPGAGEAYYDAALAQLDAAGHGASERRASVYHSKGVARLERGEPEQALDWLHRSIAMYESLESERVAQAYGSLGRALSELQRHAEAEVAHRRSIEIYRRSDPENTSLATVLNNLSLTLAAQGRVDEAIASIDEATSLRRGLPGLEAAQATTETNLAYLLLVEGRAREGGALAARAIETLAETSPGSFELLAARANLGWAQALSGETGRALELLRAVAAEVRVALGDDHPVAIRARGRVGAVVLRDGRVDEARELLEPALAALGERGDGVSRADILAPLAAALCSWHDDASEAERGLSLARAALEAYESTYGAGHWLIALARVEEARCLAALERAWERGAIEAAAGTLRAARGDAAWSTRRAVELLESTE